MCVPAPPLSLSFFLYPSLSSIYEWKAATFTNENAINSISAALIQRDALRLQIRADLPPPHLLLLLLPLSSKGGRLSAPIPAKANAKLISRISCNYGGNWRSLTRFTLGKHTLTYPTSPLLPLKLSVVVFLVCLARFWLLFIAFSSTVAQIHGKLGLQLDEANCIACELYLCISIWLSVAVSQL